MKLYFNFETNSQYVFIYVVPTCVEKLNLSFKEELIFSYKFIQLNKGEKYHFGSLNRTNDNFIYMLLSSKEEFIEVTEKFIEKHQVVEKIAKDGNENYKFSALLSIIQSGVLNKYLSEEDLQKLFKIFSNICVQLNNSKKSSKYWVDHAITATSRITKLEDNTKMYSDGDRVFLKPISYFVTLPNFKKAKTSNLNIQKINSYELLFNNNLSKKIFEKNILEELTNKRNNIVKETLKGDLTRKIIDGKTIIENLEFEIVFCYDLIIK